MYGTKKGVYAPPASDSELNEKIAVLSSLIQIQINHSTLPLEWKKFALTDAAYKLDEKIESQFLHTGIPISKDEVCEYAIERNGEEIYMRGNIPIKDLPKQLEDWETIESRMINDAINEWKAID